jgi:hypothetical protein
LDLQQVHRFVELPSLREQRRLQEQPFRCSHSQRLQRYRSIRRSGEKRDVHGCGQEDRIHRNRFRNLNRNHCRIRSQR